MITKREMAAIYEAACAKARRDPDASECKAWLSRLAMFDRRDLEDALVEWAGQSRFLPTAAEIAPIVVKIRNARLARASEDKLLARWLCETCHTTCCGFIDPSDQWPRRCRNHRSINGKRRRCGLAMREVHRAPYSSYDKDEDMDEAA